MLSYLNNTNDWLLPDTFTCLLSVMTTYVTSFNIELHSEINITPLVLPAKWAFYVSNQFLSYPQTECVSAVLISKSFDQVSMNGKYERMIVVTEDIENVTTLWTRSRILETIVLVPNKSHINAFTWYPYREKKCFNTPILEFVGVCEDGNWKTNLFPNKIPKQFFGCPVYYKSSPVPPDNVEINGSFTGREPILMDMIAKTLNLSVFYKPSTGDFYRVDFTSDSAIAMILRGEVDFAFASIALTYVFNMFMESLPSYRDEPIEWMLPLPKEKNRISSIYSGFPFEMWIAMVTISLVFGLLTKAISIIEKCSWNWVDLMAVSVASPIITSDSLILRIFYLYFQFYSLHIAWFYQGTLLQNLVNTPMQKQIRNVQGALDAKLPVYLYPWLVFYFNHSEPELWNQILSPDKHIYTFNIPYDKIVKEKSAFLLGTTIRDGWELRKHYHESLTDMIYLIPFINSLVTVYGHRGSPLTTIYNKYFYYVVESGIFWHITVLQTGYNDFPAKKLSNTAKALEFEPLQGAFILLGGLLLIACIVFIVEVSISLCDSELRRLGCLKKKRPQRRKPNINIY